MTSENDPTYKKIIVVIGDGGLGKTSLVNAIAGTKFLTGDAETDITTDMQRAYIGDTVIIDTPGASHNIEKWWADLHSIGKVHGVILLVTRQQRASAYGVFYYVCKYLEVNKLPFRMYWAGEYREYTDPENFLYGAIHRKALQKQEGVSDVRKWIKNLDENFSFAIFHPTQLFQELKNSKTTISELQGNLSARDRTIIQQSIEIEQVKTNLIETKRQLNAKVESLHEKLKSYTELANKLTVAGKANKPSRLNYAWAWVPMGGSVLLSERRAYGREVYKVARDIIENADRVEKENPDEGEVKQQQVVTTAV